MKRRWIVAAILGVLGGCRAQQEKSAPPVPVRELSSDKLPPVIQKAIEATAARQATAARGMTTTIHRAYNYKGYSWHEESPEGKVVAVDVEFGGYSPAFDLDDIDLVDGASGESYGSNPEVALLRPDGSQAIDEHRDWPVPPGPLRVLLIYSAPRTMRAAKLTYWDQALTPQASKLQNTGPALRPPRRESKP